jgi:hypothetical protein
MLLLKNTSPEVIVVFYLFEYDYCIFQMTDPLKRVAIVGSGNWYVFNFNYLINYFILF